MKSSVKATITLELTLLEEWGNFCFHGTDGSMTEDPREWSVREGEILNELQSLHLELEAMGGE